MTDNLKKEDIAKAIETLVEQTLNKAMPTSVPANGGKDEIKSGTPHSEKESDGVKKEVKKSAEEEAADLEKAKKEKEDKEKKEKAEKDEMEKSKKESDEKDKEKKDEKKEMPFKMKKAMEELSELSDEEIELVKAWREEKAAEQEEVTKSQTSGLVDHSVLAKAISDAVSASVEPLRKALEAKEAKVEELEKSIKKIASQPAYDRRSISTLETVEKSGGSEPQDISKAQVLDKMLELQMSGKGVRSTHIAEFESTNNISNPEIKKLVMESFK